MKDLTLEEFAGGGIKQISNILQEATMGSEIYRVKTWKSGSFVIMSEDEYNIHHEALQILVQNANKIPQEWIDKLKNNT